MKITMESSILTNKIISSEIEIVGKIMATTIYLKLVSQTKTKFEIDADIKSCINILKNFEKSYSRFIKDNTLAKFNSSTEGIIDKEFLELLNLSKEYFDKTEGIFDIGVLPILQNEGYVLSKNKGYLDKNTYNNNFVSVKNLEIKNDSYKKPLDLKIDLGGIGKGYINDVVSNFLRKNGYTNFVVDTGGDIRFEGKNIEENLDYWICGIQSPKNKNDVLLLKLNNKSVATSGTNKRSWKLGNTEKNHIININSKTSLNSDYVTCTVIADTTTDADIFAKTFLINDSIELNKENFPIIFIDKNDKVFYNNLTKEYLYED